LESGQWQLQNVREIQKNATSGQPSTPKPERMDGSQRITYVCAECRRLRQGKQVAKDTPLPSLIAIRNAANDIHWAGEGNGAEHCCEGPKSRTVVIIFSYLNFLQSKI
jgi:hypothetical protein